jgi:hypothetical protein
MTGEGALTKGEVSMATKSMMFGARPGFLLVSTAVALALFALSPVARAVSPQPDGGYPNGNTAEGSAALLLLTTGSNNTAIGSVALEDNTTGSDNTATGASALLLNTTGNGNTATGFLALVSNSTGDFNTATVFDALAANLSGNNTATGAVALQQNTDGQQNTADGSGALRNNTCRQQQHGHRFTSAREQQHNRLPKYGRRHWCAL